MKELTKKNSIIFIWSFLLLFFIMCAFIRTAMMMLHHVPLDYNEGWNAQLAKLASMGGGKLYSLDSGLIFNNYPPLSFLVLGEFVRLGFDAILVGRIISLLSVLVSSVLILWIIQAITGRFFAALAGAFAFLLTANTAFYGYVGLDDPQWFAQAFMLGGLAVFLGKNAGKPNTTQLFFSVMLIVLGGFIKHNLVALPLAICVWLFFVDKRKAFLWGGMGISLLLVGFAACYAAYGTNFFRDVFLHQRVIRLGRVFHGVRELLPMGGLLIIGCWEFFQLRRPRSWSDPATLVMLFLIFGIIFGELEALGQGVDYNCMFDALVAGAILAGIGLGGLVSFDGMTRQLILACSIISLPLIVLILLRSVVFYKETHAMAQQEAVWDDNIAFVHVHKSSLLCTDMALCYWADGSDAVDIFNLFQAVRKGKTEFLLRDQINKHVFASVQVEGTAISYSSGIAVLDGWLAQAGYRPVAVNGHKIVLLGR